MAGERIFHPLVITVDGQTDDNPLLIHAHNLNERQKKKTKTLSVFSFFEVLKNSTC